MSDITPVSVPLQAADVRNAVAPKAAKTMHPKLPAVRPIGDLSGVSDDELDPIDDDVRAREAREGPR